MKIVGKWIKGIFFKKPMLSLRCVDKKYNPEHKYLDIKVSMAQWNNLKIGEVVYLNLEQDPEDGLWYPIYK